jgi:hypothetical protein
MRCAPELLSCAAVAVLALAGCPSSNGGTGTTTPENPPPPQTSSSPELDKLMRTRMNVAYSQLVYMVFHAETGPDFPAISDQSAKMTEAIANVLSLPPPPVVQSEQARQVYRDYNIALKRDNERFIEATSRKDMAAMSATLTKIGDTCSACHKFFRVEIKDAAE